MAAYLRLADNYYNEFDENAAAWLRELIRRGLIAPGDVDTRSIVDVRPDDLTGYTQCHFFAGIGVWSYALRLAGWPDDRPVWTGSPPCQPFSTAGKGLGTADERHLWPAFFHLIDVCRPDTFFGEQVASKDALAWLDHVSADVEGAGYAFGAFDLCAAGFGAPHIRQRLKFVGHRGVGVTLGDAKRSRLERHERHGYGGGEPGWINPHALGSTAEGREPSGLALPDDAFWRANLSRGDFDDGTDAGRPEGAGDARTGGAGCRMGNPSHATSERDARALPRTKARVDGAGIAVDGCVSFRSEYAGPSLGERPGPTNGLWGDADWLLCRDGKWRPVEPGTFPLVDGAAARVGRLRGYGNAIVAPAAAHFIAAFLEAEAEDFDCRSDLDSGGVIEMDFDHDLLAWALTA